MPISTALNKRIGFPAIMNTVGPHLGIPTAIRERLEHYHRTEIEDGKVGTIISQRLDNTDGVSNFIEVIEI